jgi:hypothetical protein
LSRLRARPQALMIIKKAGVSGGGAAPPVQLPLHAPRIYVLMRPRRAMGLFFLGVEGPGHLGKIVPWVAGAARVHRTLIPGCQRALMGQPRGGRQLGISCGYLPLLKHCSLTLSITSFVTQSCPCYTPIGSDLATLHPARPLRHRSSPEQAAAPGSSDPIVPCAQVGGRSKQVMNSPLNQGYVTCMLVSRPIEDTTRYRG